MCDLKTKGREWSGIENSLAGRREAHLISSKTACTAMFSRTRNGRTFVFSLGLLITYLSYYLPIRIQSYILNKNSFME